MRASILGFCVLFPWMSAPLPVSAAELTEVTPRLVSTLGGTVVTFVGSGFAATMFIQVNGVSLTSQQFVDSGHIRGTTPALATGVYTATVRSAVGGIVASLANAVEAAPPPTLRSVTPTEVLADGSTTVTITGNNFRTETVFTIGRNEIFNPTGTATRRTGKAPALGPKETPGPRDLIAEDSRGRDVLDDAVTYVAVPPEIESIVPRHFSTERTTSFEVHGTGFTEDHRLRFDQGVGSPSVSVKTHFENATLLEGTAPAHARGTFDAVLIDSTTGNEVLRLPKAVEYVAPWAPGPQEIEGTLVEGVAELQWVNPTAYSAIEVYREGRLIATLAGNARSYVDVGASSTDSVDFKLVGKLQDGYFGASHAQVAVRICDPPADHGVADRGEKDFELRGMHPTFEEGGGGAAASSQAYHATYVDPAIEAVFMNELPAYVVSRRQPNEISTGFTILEDATKLRIAIHGAKLFNGPDLSLRVLIQSVTSGVDRVEELEVPDVFVGVNEDWMDFTYNTERPFPEPSDPPFPPADYKVTLYAVGGGVVEGFYSISSDYSNDQILVPGIGCPPYPLVRVEDTTGRNSNPEILEIHQYGESQSTYFPVSDGEGGFVNSILATLEAETSDPDGNPIISHRWTVKKGNRYDAEILSVKESAANTVLLRFPDYGYYFVDLAVEDNRCGKVEKTCLVKIYPPPPCFTAGAAMFTYPFPKPNREYYVPDLPGGMDAFSGSVPVTFRAFVVDPGFCEGASAKTHWVEMAIFPPADFGAGSNQPLGLTNGQTAVAEACIPEGPETCVSSAESNDNSGGRFWEVKFQNLNLLPHLRYPNGTSVTTYRLMARGSTNNVFDAPNAPADWGPWLPIRVLNAAKNPIVGSEVMNICPKPGYLDEPGNYATGNYEASTQKYFFTTDSAPPGAGSHEFPDTESVEITGGELPPQSNSVRGVSQKGTLVMDKGVWDLPSFKGGIDTTAFSGDVSGTKELLAGGGGAGDGSGATDGGGASYGFDAETLSFDYCMRENLFEESFDTYLFKSMLYCCFVGPIPVSVSISVSLGLTLIIDTQIETHLSAIDSSNPFHADFWLLPQADICLAASICADVLFGVISIEAGFDFITSFRMPFHLWADRLGLHGPDVGLEITMTLALWLRLCAFWGILCIPDLEFNILEDYPLVQTGNAGLAPAGCPGGGGGAALERNLLDGLLDGREKGRGAGSPPIPMTKPDFQLSIASAPSGDVQVVAGVFYSPGRLGAMARMAGEEWGWPPARVNPPESIESEGAACDPEVLFIDEDTVIIAWTHNYANEDPLLQGLDPSVERTPEEINRVFGNMEIVYRIGQISIDPIQRTAQVGWDNPVRLTDDADAPGGLRSDGKVALALAPGTNTVWATWVRYETSDMMDPVTREIQMRQTSIYAQRIVGGVPQGSAVRVSSATPGIDIEPAIARASTNTAMAIVWVSDDIHEDLVTSNRGRALLYSKLSGQTWSAPTHVLDPDSEATIPGILEPSLMLKDANHAMVAFTALPSNAAEEDVGIQNTRIVYTVKLLDGIWQAPVLVYKKCNTPLHAHWTELAEMPEAFEETPWKPDYTIFMHEVGPYGTRLGAGNAVALTYDGTEWSQPIDLTPDGRVHQGIAAAITARGEVVVVQQSPGVASRIDRELGIGGGAANGTLHEDFLVQSIAAVADPAISYARISDPHAGPGSRITATIGVENHGFVGTPRTTSGVSLLDMRVVYLLSDGTRRQVAARTLPVLKAGENTLQTFDLTIPREPVEILFEVDPVEGELNTEDNRRIRALGAQAPRNLSARFLRNPRSGEAVLLKWTNQGLYDGILLYRDGLLAAELPGSATSYVDRGAGLLDQQGILGAHEYALRSVRGKSRSSRVIFQFTKPEVQPNFLRGDAQGDGIRNISDGVYVLNFLFTGGRTPPCLDAADTNDSGDLNITDGVFILNFLFLGGRAPPSPFLDCGEDPTPDSLGCADPPACTTAK